MLLPGDDPQEFAGRLRYLQDDLQARNSLEAVVIERLAGDLWKSDRSDRSFCNRINFRLRHESDDQARKDADEAVELPGQQPPAGSRSFRCRSARSRVR